MISFILTSRVTGNPDTNIEQLLGSAAACASNPSNLEFIIKYDSDDDQRPSDAFFRKFPFPIKVHTWSRGEGRHGLHLDHQYLFAQRDMRSRFVMICADDFTFYRNGFDADILAIPDEICFVGYARPRMELYTGHLYEENYARAWTLNEGVCLPCMSVRTAEVLSNFGQQCNADNWQTLLVLLMWQNYGMDIWKTIAPWYLRNPTDGQSGYGKGFNNMVVDGSRPLPENKYYFKLVEQQCKNLYLNMKHG